MRILYLTPQPPYPPNKGTSTRNFNLIKAVAARHEVHLLTLVENSQASSRPQEESVLPEDDYHILLRHCATVRSISVPARRSTLSRSWSTMTSSTPDLGLRLASRRLDQALEKVLRDAKFDVIQVEGLEMVPAWLGLVKRGWSPPAVLDCHNCEYLLQRRAFTNDIVRPAKWPGAGYSFIQWLKLRRYEAVACGKARTVVAVSEKDRDALSIIAPTSRLVVVPNGVDTEYFHTSGRPRKPNALVFTGTMDFRPNVDAALWFCRQVFPLLKKEEPETQFFIVGQRPKAEVRTLADIPGVTVTGTVEDVRPYLWEAGICVVPLRVGGGTRFKILEAMATGTSVVSTTLGAEGINITPGQDAILADHPSEMAAAIIRLIRDPGQALSLADRGREFVLANYDWHILGKQMLAVYDQLANAVP